MQWNGNILVNEQETGLRIQHKHDLAGAGTT